LFAALRAAGCGCSSVSVPRPARSLSVGIGAGIGGIITDTDTKPIPVVSADTRYPILVSVSAYSVLLFDRDFRLFFIDFTLWY